GVDPDTYLEFGLNPIIRALEDRFEVLELKNVLASVAELAKLAKEANFAINYIIPVAVVPAIKALGSRFEISQVPSIGEVLIKLVKQEEIEKLNANIYHSLHYGIAPLIEVLGNDFEISKLTQIAYQTFRVTGQARILGSSDSRFLSSGFVPVAQALAKFNCLDLETLKIAAGYFIDSAKIATAVHGKQRARQSSLSAKFNYDQLPGIFASALTQTINHLGEVNELNTENLKKVVAIIEKAVASNEDVSQIVKYMLIPLLKAFSRESEISKALDFADRVVGEYSSSESIS
ncbi:MAG: hypothetical protein KDD56_10385, partial [Bdellovibrionales bacterium]|nr:hypothetical protein [Bdellovibrionales bacterium]